MDTLRQRRQNGKKEKATKNGAWYYFDTATGKMAHGKYYRDGAYYYYDTATGIMQYGEQTIDGDEYYFDTETEQWLPEKLNVMEGTTIMMMNRSNAGTW